MMDIDFFDSLAPGPNLLFLGGVHGDERPGYWGLDKLIAELYGGAIRLAKGRLSVISRVNAAAVAKNERFIDENLNRIVRRHLNPKTHEQRLANELASHLDAADVVLDLHATTAPTPPFAFLDDDTPASRAWADATDARFVLTGWRALYRESETPTTTDYVLDHGKRALTIELGQRTDIEAIEVGYRAALQTLAHFGLVSHLDPGVARAGLPRHLALTRVVVREREGALAHPWQNFDFVAAGATVARYADGTALTADQDAHVVMPNERARIGEEWFYFATPV